MIILLLSDKNQINVSIYLIYIKIRHSIGCQCNSNSLSFNLFLLFHQTLINGVRDSFENCGLFRVIA